MTARRVWIVLAITVVIVLAVSTGVVVANQRHQSQMRDDHVAVCEEMHSHMHGTDSTMPGNHAGMDMESDDMSGMDMESDDMEGMRIDQ